MENRIVTSCKVVHLHERIKEKLTGEKEVISVTVEAKLEVLEKDGERIGVLKGATMLGTGPTVEEAQAKAVELAKVELGL